MQCLLLPPIRFLVRRQIVTSYNLSLLVKNKLDLESIRSSPSDGFRVGRVGVLGGGVGILIMMQQVRLMLFLLKMVDFSVSPSPLWVNFGFKLGWNGLGLGLEGLGTNGFGVGD